MADGVQPIPEGRSGVVPYLAVKNCAAAIDFYQEAFGAEEQYRLVMPDRSIGHAELKIGSALFMMSDEFPDMGVLGPESLGGTPVMLSMYVEDADAFVARASQAGATVLQPVEDQFFGDRSGKLADPFGHRWAISTRLEDVSPEEMQDRLDKLYGG